MRVFIDDAKARWFWFHIHKYIEGAFETERKQTSTNQIAFLFYFNEKKCKINETCDKWDAFAGIATKREISIWMSGIGKQWNRTTYCNSRRYR